LPLPGGDSSSSTIADELLTDAFPELKGKPLPVVVLIGEVAAPKKYASGDVGEVPGAPELSLPLR